MRLSLLLPPLLALLCVSCINDDPAGRAEDSSFVQTGDTAPDFTVALLDGGRVTLSELRGETVLLTFFASWCPACQEELAAAQRIVPARFAGRPFRYLAVSRAETREEVEAFRDEYGLTFPVGLDPDGRIYGLYASRNVPRSYLIDPDGIVVRLTMDHDDAQFEALLREAELLLDRTGSGGSGARRRPKQPGGRTAAKGAAGRSSGAQE